MTEMIERAPVPLASGMLCKEHSHSAWVTNDLDRAIEVFRNRYGIGDVSFIDADSPGGGHIKVAFAWAGGQILEILQGTGPGYEFYNELLPEDEFAIRFHHLGFIVRDDAGWEQLEREISEGGWETPLVTLEHNFIDAYYIKAPELGHYLEYVRPFEAGSQFYNAVPVS